MQPPAYYAAHYSVRRARLGLNVCAHPAGTRSPASDTPTNPPAALTSAPAAGEQAKLAPKFQWSEYEQVVIAHSADRGNPIFHVALQIDRGCPMRAAAMQMIRNVVADFGTVLAIHPEDNTLAETTDVVEMAIASKQDEQWIAKKSRIPAVIRDVVVVRAASAAPESKSKTVFEIADTLTQPAQPAAPAPRDGALHAR